MSGKVEVTLETYKQAFNEAPIGMALVSLDGEWLMVNDSVCKIVGYTKSELMNLTFQDITHEADLNKDLQNVKDMLNGKIDQYEMEKRYIKKDGHEVWVLLSVTLVRREGKPYYFISQIQDIDERKRYSLKIKKLNTLLLKREDRVLELKNEIKKLKSSK